MLPDTQLATNNRRKNYIEGTAFAFSSIGALCDALQKYLASRMLLDEDHLGGYLEESHAEGLLALHVFAIIAAVMTMLESYTLETGNIHLLVHKICSVNKDKLEILWKNTRICSLNFLISSFVLFINFFACTYTALGTIDAMDDPALDSIKSSAVVEGLLYFVTALFVVANTPLAFATDGGFFERFVQRGVAATSSFIMLIASLCRKNTEEESPFRYKGLGIYRVKPIAIDEEFPLLPYGEESNEMSNVQNQPMPQRIWTHLMDMSECYDSALEAKPHSGFGWLAWFMMQFVLGTFGAVIEAGFASAIFDSLNIPLNNFTKWVRIFMMLAAFSQDWGLDGAVSASTVAQLIDHPKKSEKFSWTTTIMVCLLAIFGASQAFAMGYIGMEQMLPLFFNFSDETKMVLNCCAGGLNVVSNLGVELKIFSAKLSQMFPPALPPIRPINDSEEEPSRCCVFLK